MKCRNRVLGLLSLLMTITMLDRICISVAGPRMQDALHIGPIGWGWVNGVFTLAYAFFEIPAGVLGDRIGPRRVLTRIVLWWSAFTAFTGLVRSLSPLLAIRFLFGIGEAGAYPNAGIVVARWFPVHERARAFGYLLMAGQLGGAFAPLLVVPIQMRYGWRASFLAFGVLGPLWAGAWYFWYRDSPSEKSGVTQTELDETAGLPSHTHHRMPWASALRSANVWSVFGICFCYIYTYSFFSSWFHTYLVRARGFAEKDLWLSSLPYIVAACANLAGGYVGNLLVQRLGLRWGRCAIGFASLTVSGLAILGAMATRSPLAALGLLTLANAGITFQQPIMFSVCLDIGGEFSGAIIGMMNTAAGAAAFVGSLAFGYIVSFTHSYNMPMIPMAGFLFFGAYLWLRVDPRKQIGAGSLTPPGSIVAPALLT